MSVRETETNRKEGLAAIADIEVRYEELLSRHTGFETGGPARAMILPQTRAALIETLAWLRESGEQYYLLGNGTNVLAPDEGYDGYVVKTGQALTDVSLFDGGRVRCGAGVQVRQLCETCADAGLSGLAFAYGIPGTVGGGVFMNAGAYDGEMKDVVTAVEVLDEIGDIRTLSNAELYFGYRTSAVQGSGWTILSIDFQLEPGAPETIYSVMQELMQRRRDKQPLELPSCGSTFKRPAGAYASKLIDDCGLCGYGIGGAAVSEKHCGFVVNTGGATSRDVLELIAFIKETVKKKTGYTLECEVRVLK